MVKIVQRLRRGYGKSRLSITTIVVSQWSRYLLCKLLKAGWSKYFISFFKPCKFRTYLNMNINVAELNNLLYYNESNIFSNFDKLSCEYRCLPYTRLKNILLQMQDLTKLQKMHFFIGDTFFSKFVFCSYKSEINATLYNTISWYSLFNFFSFCLSLKQWK